VLGSACAYVKIDGMTMSTIWRRRVLLMLGVALLVAIPVTLIVRDSDEEPESQEQSSPVEELALNPAVGDSEIQALYQVPKGWKLDREGEVLKLSSDDDLVQVGITSPGPAEDSKELLDGALASIKDTYDQVEITPGSGKKVGGLPAKGAVVAAKGKEADLRILVAVTEGRERAYLVEVFTSAAAPPTRVAEAQRFLESLELEG
jgi:hypothetical protein